MARLVRADHSSHSEEIGRPREAGDGGGWRLGAAGANQRLSRFSARTFGLDAIQEMGIICNTSVTGTVRIRMKDGQYRVTLSSGQGGYRGRGEVMKGETDKDWSAAIAGLIACDLIDAGVITLAQNDRARAIIAEKLLIRLVIGDRPGEP